ncbi:MAG: nuclear transport factor 2 family protein [Nitrospiraceae bacterium]
MTQRQAEQFARYWIEAWNDHNLDAVISHYADNVVFTSPFVVVLLDDPSGTISGRAALRAYFEKGLAAYPDLTFELLDVLAGVNSVTLYHRSVNGKLAAEVMAVDAQGMIAEVRAHYRDGDSVSGV